MHTGRNVQYEPHKLKPGANARDAGNIGHRTKTNKNIGYCNANVPQTNNTSTSGMNEE